MNKLSHLSLTFPAFGLELCVLKEVFLRDALNNERTDASTN